MVLKREIMDVLLLMSWRDPALSARIELRTVRQELSVTRRRNPFRHANASRQRRHVHENRFPVTHRRAIRTTNLIERLFVEERRRLKIIPNAFGEATALDLHFATSER